MTTQRKKNGVIHRRGRPAVDALQKPILRWFARAGRSLPWRKTRDPYRVWVSEVMLQQTQVDRVIGFYRAFLKAFPTVQALADAAWPAVLERWRGLGYYRRAHSMMRAAQAIVAEHDGRFPRSVAELERLPGIGPYTARAIAVFAYEADELVLDTNTRRVIARALSGRDTAPPSFYEQRASAVVPRGKSWPFHQAMMDLGATVCTAREPRCAACPLAGVCAFAGRRPAPRPGPAPKRAGARTPAVDVAAAVIHRDGKLLLTKRPRGHLKGCWEFPGGKRKRGEDWRRCLKREIREELGIEVAVRPHDWSADWDYPGKRVHIRFHRCSILAGTPKPHEGQAIRWVLPQELSKLRLPPADAQIVAALAKARFVDAQANPLKNKATFLNAPR